jgi:hypothetical protein
MKLTNRSGSFAWILVPSYLSYVFAIEIFDGLSLAAERDGKLK